MKKKILIDLDVLTIFAWKKGDNVEVAEEFIGRVKKGNFEVYTPYTLLELVSEWKNKKLQNAILDFYSHYSTEILTIEKVSERFLELGITRDKLTPIFLKLGIKEEDFTLVLIASAFKIDIVTFNKKHLLSKRNEINEVLRRNNLYEIDIFMPNEI